jgi:hypothetical protein
MQFALTGMLALAIAIGVGRFAFTPILPMMQKDHGLTLRMAGLLASVNYVGYFIGALSAIWIRMTTARVVMSSLVIVALLTGAMGVIHEPPGCCCVDSPASWAPEFLYSVPRTCQQLTILGRKPLSGGVRQRGRQPHDQRDVPGCSHLSGRPTRRLAVGLVALHLAGAC